MNKIILGLFIAFSLISCGDDSSSNRGSYRNPTNYRQSNYNYSNYNYSKYDYHRYNGQKYNYNWNNYANQWLSVQGNADIAYCGVPYWDATSLSCYQSCMQRVWTPYTGLQSGYVWSCNVYSCGWQLVSQVRTWYTYTWTPYYKAAYCY